MVVMKRCMLDEYKRVGVRIQVGKGVRRVQVLWLLMARLKNSQPKIGRESFGGNIYICIKAATHVSSISWRVGVASVA